MHFHYLAKLFYAGNKAMAPWNAKWLDRPLPAQTGKKQSVHMLNGGGEVISIIWKHKLKLPRIMK